MRIYTRSGDDGSTGLYGGGRVLKCDLRMDVVGVLDELNAHLGLARTMSISGHLDEILSSLQNQLFDLGAELATPAPENQGTAYLSEQHVAKVEAWIDQFEPLLPPLQTFILPGGSPVAAALHLARCVCRRGERKLVQFAQVSQVRGLVLQFVNRLGDLLFVLARFANVEAGEPDVTWQKSS